MLLARGIVEGIEQGADALRPELLALLSADEYRRQQGDIALERLAVLHDMGILLSEEPMSQGNEEQALALSGRADSLWKTLAPGEQNAYQRWRQGRGPELLALNAADFLRAASYYRAARREEPYTPWGDLWATLRWGRSRQLLLGALDLAERQQIEEMLLRLQFVAQSPDFSPGLNDFFTGYAEYLLGGEASVHLEKSAADPTVRRLFFFDLLALLCDELGRVGRFGDAERYVREITGELGQEQYGRLLLKSLQQLRQK
jgi:hypothetical protein